MINRQLIPLDGSEAARVALIYGAAIPSQSVRLLMALNEDDGIAGLAQRSGRDAWKDEARAAAEAYLQEAAAEIEAQGRKIDIVVDFGDPTDLILSQTHDVDLILMTTRGYGAGRRAVYGSVADRVARHSEIPVMLVRGGEHPVDTRPIQRIVVPLDGSDLAEAALPMAIDLADTLGIPVMLVRALDFQRLLEAAQMASSPVAAYAESIDVVRKSGIEYLAEHAQTIRNRAIPAAFEVRDGEPARELLKFVRSGDLLAMTSHGRGGMGRWLLGSVSEKLIRQAKVPVLLIRSERSPAS